MSQARFWEERAAALGAGSPLEAYATVTRSAAVVRLRDALEKAHLERLWSEPNGQRIADLGGGAGRFALWIAPRCREVVLVDQCRGLLDIAERHAGMRGIRNLFTVCSSALEWEPDGLFDRVLVMNLATHLSEPEVSRLAALCTGALRPGGVLVLKEPVSTDGRTRCDERRGPDGTLRYRAWFRPRGFYSRIFGAHLVERYRAPTLSHPFPWFAGGTEDVADFVRRPWLEALVERAIPLAVAVDPWLLRLETALRTRPALGRLLARVDVVQDLHLFERPELPT